MSEKNKRAPDISWPHCEKNKRAPDVSWLHCEKNERAPDVSWLHCEKNKRAPDISWCNGEKNKRAPDVSWCNGEKNKDPPGFRRHNAALSYASQQRRAEIGEGANHFSLAATRLHVDMVRLLLAFGADPSVGDEDGIPTFRRIKYSINSGRIGDDPASQERLREIRQLLGDPAA